MAALTSRRGATVRAARPGEGRAIAGLWRELWDAHEGWGGYPGSHDAAVYDELAARLEADAHARGGQPLLGRHVHLVAWTDGAVAGQVEGWIERQGVVPQTPYTCEVRSLIVSSWARGGGLGRALLDGLADAAATFVRDAPLVLGAEVLNRNPARAFYATLGYRPIAWSLHVASDGLADVPTSLRPPKGEAFTARVAESRDALALCVLDAELASRRRSLGDPRFDPPRAVDAATVAAIAEQLAEPEDPEARGPKGIELVTVDAHGRVRGAATFVASSLDPPFRPGQRAILGRFATDPALVPELVVAPLIAYGKRLARQKGARMLELTEMSPPGSPLYRVGVESGGAPWSTIVTKAMGRAQF